MRKRRIVFDIEADGLLHQATKIWIFVGYDRDTKETFVFSDHDTNTRPMSELPEFLDSCGVLIGHNILSYDLPMLEKHLGWVPGIEVKFFDTMIQSQVQNYRRFGFGHSLARWGEFLGYKKQEHEDWDNYSPEMCSRCVTDVELNNKVYDYLVKELNSRKQKDKLKLGLKAEMGVSRFVGRAQLYGWPFDVDRGWKLLAEMESRLQEIKDIIEPKLKTKTVQVDKDPEFKKPVWVRTGDYAKRTCDWFGLDPSTGQEDQRPIWGEYCRVEFEAPEMGSIESVKEYLYSIGWVPDDWNFKKNDKGRLVKTTPKLTDSSMKPLGEDGKLISDFFTIRSRWSILNTWLNENVTSDNRLHGDSFTIGTPTGRSRHAIIANIPSADAVYGPEMRQLFTVVPGYKMVGADSASNQNRALCHYLGNADYTKNVIESDIHTVNQSVLTKILGNLGADGRRKAKAFFVKEYEKLCELLGHPV